MNSHSKRATFMTLEVILTALVLYTAFEAKQSDIASTQNELWYEIIYISIVFMLGFVNAFISQTYSIMMP